MQEIFEIASRISTPIALSGFFATILFFIFKQILEKDIFPSLTRSAGADIIKIIVDKLFILALVAMVLGFAGYILPKPSQIPSPNNVRPNLDQNQTGYDNIQAGGNVNIFNQSETTPNKIPKLVCISKDEITLTGPGTYFVDTENKADSDDLKKIYGLSEGDEVTIYAADNDRTIVLNKGHYLKMKANFSLDNEDDFFVLKSKGSNICTQLDRQDIGD